MTGRARHARGRQAECQGSYQTTAKEAGSRLDKDDHGHLKEGADGAEELHGGRST